LEYCESVTRVSTDLSRFSNGGELVPYLVDNYGLTSRIARDFVHANTRHRWKSEDSEGKGCMLIHINRNLDQATRSLDDTLSNIKEE